VKPSSGRRCQGAAWSSRIVKPPFFEIDGVRNARDFGGQASALGGTVRRGVLLRTANFGFITEEGRATMAARGVKVVVDLRRATERAEHPNQLDGLPLRTIASDLSEREGEDLAPHLQFLRDSDLTPQASHTWMVDSYRRFPWFPQHKETFLATFAALAAGEGPLVVHCAAGKDRTGILCGLILHVLGVSRDDIDTDYLLTNHQPDLMQRVSEFADMIEARFGRRISDEAMLPMVGVHEDFLTAAWDAMHAVNGGPDGYLASIGVDTDMIAAMRANLIEKD
jgi:protein-tyrosine phosphatase